MQELTVKRLLYVEEKKVDEKKVKTPKKGEKGEKLETIVEEDDDILNLQKSPRTHRNSVRNFNSNTKFDMFDPTSDKKTNGEVNMKFDWLVIPPPKDKAN